MINCFSRRNKRGSNQLPLSGIDDVVNRLHVAEGARFDSWRSEQTRVESCSEGTQEGVLKTIQDWATGTNDARKHIFLLNGLAGIGKSTIAMTIAKWARAQADILGASFFFSRADHQLSSPRLVFSMLASQLAQFDERYKRALYDVLRADNGIGSANLQSQFDNLVLKPLSACDRERRVLIVIDALNECSPEKDVQEMLRILLCSDVASSESGGPKLRILIASRPEAHIRFVFTAQGGKGHHEQVVLHDIDDKLARDDIQRYLKTEFAKFPSRDLPKPPENWPSS